jgi:hypothetical protein
VYVDEFECNGFVGLLGHFYFVVCCFTFKGGIVDIVEEKVSCRVDSRIMASKQQKERNQNIQVFVRVR